MAPMHVGGFDGKMVRVCVSVSVWSNSFRSETEAKQWPTSQNPAGEQVLGGTVSGSVSVEKAWPADLETKGWKAW
jgi:hypothetical protein